MSCGASSSPAGTQPPRSPRWSTPPDGYLGGATALSAVLFRSPSLAVVAQGFVSYPTGFEFCIGVRGRTSRPIGPFGPTGPSVGSSASAWDDTPYDGLRLGIVFADGRGTTDLSVMPLFEAADAASVEGTPAHELTDPLNGDVVLEPAPPLLVPKGGRGGLSCWDQDYWVWGQPPPGPLTLVLEWPAEGIRESRIEVDGLAIRLAADDAEPLWPA
jgi:hypothetical protein